MKSVIGRANRHRCGTRIAPWIAQDLLGPSQGCPPPLLSELHIKLIAYSLEQLDGAFVIDKLAQAFMGQIARDKLLILAQEWERKGWLSPFKRGGPTKPRQVTPTLLALYREVRQADTLAKAT